jgi:hypothetical protein
VNNILHRKFLAVLIAVVALLSVNLALAKDYSVTAGNWKVDFKSNDTLYTEIKEETNFMSVWVKEDPGLTTRSGTIQLFEYDIPTPFGRESMKGWMSLYLSSMNKTPTISNYSIDSTDAVIAEGWDATLGRIVYGAMYPIDKDSYGSAQKVVGFISLLDRKTNFEILDSLHVEYINSPQASQTFTTAKTNNWVYPGESQETAQQTSANSGISEPYVLIKCEGTLYDKLGSYTEAGTGKVYLVTNLQIENHGYNEFSVNPNYVKVEINNVQYDYSWVDVGDLGLASLDSATLKDGGMINGAVAFEIPRNTNQYSLVWKTWESYNVKVEYVK